MEHPYLQGVLINSFFQKVTTINPFTIKNIYAYTNSDELFVEFLKNYLDCFDCITTISYYPKKKIDISFIETYRNFNNLLFFDVPLSKIKDISFILNHYSLYALTLNETGYVLSGAKKFELLKQLKYNKNISDFFKKL